MTDERPPDLPSRREVAPEPALDYDRAFRQLVHLAALNRTDKVDGAIANLVTTTLAVDTVTKFRDVPTIGDAVFVLFGVRPTEEQLQRSVDQLLEARRLEQDGAGNHKASPDEVAAANDRITGARELEASVRREWQDEVSNRLPDADIGDDLWRALQRYLALAFRRHGAETAQLLDPAARLSSPQGTLSSYLEQAIDEAGLQAHRALAGEAIDLFLAQSTPSRTLYLAQLLDGTFTFFAITLDDATSAYLKASLSPLDIFLDTNYIFGLLDLHENYFVRASKELVRLIQEQKLPFRLYYHEYTYAEMARTLQAQADRLRSRRWSVSLSRAAVEADTLDGLERLYHQANAEAPTDIDAFLSRFENIQLLLKPLGIEIYRESRGDPFTTMEKGLLIADYQDFLQNHAPRPRSDQAIDHDAALWLALRRLRRPGGSVLDSGALILTNDYWFHRFDKRLGPNATFSMPGAVVLPAQLLQLLRPLVPGTDDFDRRFVETFALPEFRTAQSGYGATSSKVMSYLATYRDLPTSTAAALLKSHALASRLRRLDEGSREFRDAVDSELIELNRGLLEEKIQLQEELAAAKTANTPIGPHPAVTALEAPSDKTQLREMEDRASRAERRLRWTLRLIAALLFFAGIAAIYGFPQLLNWNAFQSHPHAAGIQLALAIAWAGCCWPLFAQNNSNRIGAAAGLIVGALLAMTQII